VHLVDGDLSSPALFLRGKLDWPIGGASRNILLIPREVEQASPAPGSHLLNVWIGAE
jgi:hypothetical protein